jgi:hypothetical protein
MTAAAGELLRRIRAELTVADDRNRLLPAVTEGRAPKAVLGAFAAEEMHIVPSDRRSFLLLAARSENPAAAEFFSLLASAESTAQAALPALGTAVGLDEVRAATYAPRAGCQAYPAYLAWLALNAEPAEAVLAVSANVTAFAGWCGTLATAVRKWYGFDDAACAFFDQYAHPCPDLDRHAATAVQQALDAGQPLASARRYGRLLQSYELMFWNTLADLIPA